jgi:hypothetical protein
MKRRGPIQVNVLMDVEILKSGLGWSDAELMEHVAFDLQVRHTLGLDDLRTEVFTLRTLYNFRRRVRAYAPETGVNLYAESFEHITDEQLAEFSVDAGWQKRIAAGTWRGLCLTQRRKGRTVAKIFKLLIFL